MFHIHCQCEHKAAKMDNTYKCLFYPQSADFKNADIHFLLN